MLESGRVHVTIAPDNDRQGEMLSQAITRRGTNGQRVVLAHSDPSHLANSQDRAVDKMTIHKEPFACTKDKNTTIIKNILAKEIKYHSTIVPQARHLNLNESMWQACPFQLSPFFWRLPAVPETSSSCVGMAEHN